MSSSAAALRILYIEDNDLVREITLEILSHPGHTIVAVASAEEALELFESDAFDLVVTDISLPAMSGLDLARQILQRDRNVRIIIATGYNLQGGNFALGERVRAITKPFDQEQFDQILNELCPPAAL